MSRIAISYRREDSAAITGRIFDRLTAQYGSDSVFRDIDNIPLGVDFREHIDAMLAATDITLVIIGKRWLGLGRGRRRINDPADPVRVEVETALRIGKPVIPVLVESAGMPNADQLPDTLKDLIYRNGLDVDSGRDFDQHIERLIRNIDPILARITKQRAEAARQAEEEQQRAEAARQAEEEQQRAEAARQAQEKRQAETARQAQEKRQAETAHPAEEEAASGRDGAAAIAADERGAGEAHAPSKEPQTNLSPLLKIILKKRSKIGLSAIGILPILAIMVFILPKYPLHLSDLLVVIAILLFASLTPLSLILEWRRGPYLVASLNLLSVVFAIFMLIMLGAEAWVLITVSFAIESVAALLDVWSRRVYTWKCPVSTIRTFPVSGAHNAETAESSAGQ